MVSADFPAFDFAALATGVFARAAGGGAVSRQAAVRRVAAR
jgi:hypothetical protein